MSEIARFLLHNPRARVFGDVPIDEVMSHLPIHHGKNSEMIRLHMGEKDIRLYWYIPDGQWMDYRGTRGVWMTNGYPNKL